MWASSAPRSSPEVKTFLRSHSRPAEFSGSGYDGIDLGQCGQRNPCGRCFVFRNIAEELSRQTITKDMALISKSELFDQCGKDGLKMAQ